MGGIISTLLGVKHGENLRKEHNTAQFIMSELHDAATNPKNALPDETVDWLVKQAGSIFNKETGQAIKTHFEQIRAKRALDQAQSALPQQPAGQAPPVIGPQQPQARVSQPLLGMPKPPEDDAGPLSAPGPTRPFEGGAPSGVVAPTQESPALKVASQASQSGFGGPMPTPPPMLTPPPSQGSFFRMSPAQRGVDAAVFERPALESKGEVERQNAAKEYEANAARIKAEAGFGDLSKRQQFSALTGKNITPEPHFNISGTTVSVDGDKGVDGQPVPTGTPGTRFVSNGETYFSPAAGRLQYKRVLKDDGTEELIPVNPITGKVGEADPNLTSAPRVRTVNITHADGTTSRVGITATGKWVSDDPRLRGVNPAMLTTSSDNFKMVPQVDGSYAMVPVTTTSSKVGPGARGSVPSSAPSSAPGPGLPKAGGGARVGTPVKVGGKSLTPGQVINLDSKAKVFDNTIELANSVKNRLPLLNSLVDAKKVDLQTDPSQGIVKAFINRTLPMTEEEKVLAADFVSLMEHINTLRGPLAATGFRGHEAFAALQAQRGQLLANPDVTARVLANTIKALEGQRDVILNNPAMPKPPNQLPPPPANRKPLNEIFH